MRLYAPILMIAVGVFVWRHNDPAGPNHLIFPGMDYLPGFAGDVVKQGQLTWQILVGVGSVWLTKRLIDWARARKPAPVDEESQP
jgi:hypothetical protein